MSYKDFDEYKAHQKIGFPKIDDEIQLKMLTTGNFQHILDLLPEIKTFAFCVLDEYITVSKKQLKEYLQRSGYVDNKLETFLPTQDGLWLQKNGDKYILFERERGQVSNLIHLNEIDEVLNEYTNILGIWCK